MEIGKEWYEKKVKGLGFGEDLEMGFRMKGGEVWKEGIEWEMVLGEWGYGEGELVM